MSQYGLPYMGSKSKIADKVCNLFPEAENFYDLFGGGFSITHCMIKNRSKDYKQFHFNEIRSGLIELVQDCIAGKYNYDVFKPEWVSREDFFANKETDIYKKIVWSFGNEGGSYIFGKHIEQEKRSMHNAIIFNEFDDYAKEFFGFDKFKDGYDVKTRRLFCKSRIAQLSKKRCDLEQLEQLEWLQQLQQLERLQQLQQLERLEQLQQLERLEFYNNDYREVKIRDNSIIYCDIPYEATAKYDNDFNHRLFFEWVQDQKNPVFVSEYNVDKPFMKLIASFNVRSTLSASSNNCKKVEKVYCNEMGFKQFKERLKQISSKKSVR
jgi:site-specific DNA-adenine methylase